MIAFGPVPSRRLGKSLGVNNIPAKICSYSCIYCQLGNTIKLSVDRQSFYKPEKIFKGAEQKYEKAKSRNEKIDYLTFVPDGEPTLDLNLKKEIKFLRRLQIPIAILTNASLIWREEVKEALLDLDFVSVKIDAINERLWKRIDRPHKSLTIGQITDGIVEFSKDFKGTLVTETMLVQGINYTDELEKIANFLAEVEPNKAYVAIPTRPPAEEWVKPATEKTINEAYQVFAETLGIRKVEYLIGYEGNAFASTGNIEEDLLSITSVHPMREEAVKKILSKANSEWTVIKTLLNKGSLIEIEYENHKYYMRKLPSRMKR
jgi:wyosine [tRNA(Phe)-imidazoG37] synthetase (radical SAM superfamily)